MRLLRLDENGELSLAEYAEKNTPPYAILSHRWGKDEEEVTFRDVTNSTGKDKIGYQKVLSCGKQAAKDGFSFFWVDTCAIDKTSSSELSEAINSMWRWYRNSQVCYAYLDDVTLDSSTADAEISFAKSKWFTRGWTLQELLAPRKVVFFDAAWNLIGNKDGLADEIHDITKIDEYYLQGGSLAKASIAERMSWVSTRETKRSEDIAYCLLGIFDINMPLLYGEGTKAFQRLQEDIMKQSDDHSIFAWESGARSKSTGVGQSYHPRNKSGLLSGYTLVLLEFVSLLAPSPIYFKSCGDIVRSTGLGPAKPYAKTNRGLYVELPVYTRPGRTDDVLAILNCRRRHEFFSDIALHFCKDVRVADQYRRVTGQLRAVSTTYRSRATLQSMYLEMGPSTFDAEGDPGDDSYIIRALPDEYVVTQVLPAWSWSPRSRAIADDQTYAPRLVIVDSKAYGQLAFMIYKRKYFWGVIKDARLIPVSSERKYDIQKLYSQWEFADPATMPRCQTVGSRTVTLRASPSIIRSKRLVALDIVVSTKQPSMRLEVVERLAFYIRFLHYQGALLFTASKQYADVNLPPWHAAVGLTNLGLLGYSTNMKDPGRLFGTSGLLFKSSDDDRVRQLIAERAAFKYSNVAVWTNKRSMVL